MKALAITPGTSDIALIDRPEPRIATPTELKLRVLQVGICGTDREEAAGGRADAPAGQSRLVIGHEMFGEVVATGSAVRSAQPGDFGVFMVRRPCGVCPACLARRSDMCSTGNYTERGIKGADGYQQEYVVDEEAFFLPVPPTIRHLGVLTEPMSVGEKAIDEAVRIQAARLPEAQPETWLQGKRALVVGLGPIGLLACAILRLRGAVVLGLDIVDSGSIRAQTLRNFGGQYIDGRQAKTLDLDDALGQIDLIFEATGVAQLEFDLIDALGINGVYVLTGIPAGDRPVTMQPGSLIQQLVLKNQVMLGSVNAGYEHYRMAIEDLEAACLQFPEAMAGIITDRHPYQDFSRALSHHDANEIKCVLEWN